MKRKLILPSLTAMQLKWFAAVFMLLDHFSKVFRLQIVSWMGQALSLSEKGAQFCFLLTFSVGRTAFPLFAFFAAQGVIHTRNRRRYLSRLFLFGLVSEPPFQLMVCLVRGQALFLRPALTNVLFTLWLGGLACVGYDRWKGRAACLFPLVFSIVVAHLLGTDYGGVGVLLVFCCYVPGESRHKLWGAATVLVLRYGLLGPLQTIGAYGGVSLEQTVLQLAFALLSVALLACYNGRRGNGSGRFFYWFYPLHMLVLVGCRLLLKIEG